ncbi:MAG: hypothetical protein KAI43_08420 [Candidatus Aureabacteria bacterium]|nr:hypothetical protein [Candidatus Auribacterota bacterium]
MEKPIHIIYSLSGEGRGHATVALAIHKELTTRLPLLKIHYFCGGKAFYFLNESGLDVTKIPHLSYSYKKGAVKPFSTFLKNLRIMLNKKNFISIKEQIISFSPVLCLCDFEYFVPKIIKKLKIPLININHQGIITETKYPVPLKERLNHLSAVLGIHMISSRALINIITSFFIPPVKKNKKNNIFVGPIIRENIENSRKTNLKKDFVLVYVMDESFSWIEPLLSEITEENFIISGFPAADGKKHKNIIHKKIDPDVFLEDLKDCKCVIATSGHTLIAEALALQKPVLALYQPNQFEQFLNAHFLENMGYGKSIEAKGNILPSIKNFLKNIPRFEKNIKNCFSTGNAKTIDIIIEEIRNRKGY